MTTKGQVNEVISSLPDSAMDPRVSVVGVGGAGCNVVSSLYDREVQGLELVAVNTDEEALSKARADVKLLLNLPPHGKCSVDDAEEAVQGAGTALERIPIHALRIGLDIEAGFYDLVEARLKKAAAGKEDRA